MPLFLSRDLLHTWHSATAALLRCRLQTPPLARPFSQSPVASADGNPRPSPTVSYLIHSCGLSPEAALSASKKVRLRTTENPDSVLALLRDSGCSPSQVATIVSKLPKLLLMRATKTLKPKLEYLRGAGISAPRLAYLLCANPNLLTHGLKKIAPSLEYLQQVLPSGVPVSEVLKRSPSPFTEDGLSNIHTLRRHGVPDEGISKLVLTQPLALARAPARFEETVATVEAMGLDPRKPMFPHAVWVMAYTSKETWDRKLAVYRSLGWSDGEISSAFVKQPFVLGLSDEGIRRKMEFFAGKLGMTPATLCRNPVLLMLSLEKRVAPRCAVLKVLMDRGLLMLSLEKQIAPGCAVIKVRMDRMVSRKGEVSLASVLMSPEKHFLERFVVKYRAEAPEVVDAHLGKVEFSGFGTLARGLKIKKPLKPDMAGRTGAEETNSLSDIDHLNNARLEHDVRSLKLFWTPRK